MRITVCVCLCTVLCGCRWCGGGVENQKSRLSTLRDFSFAIQNAIPPSTEVTFVFFIILYAELN